VHTVPRPPRDPDHVALEPAQSPFERLADRAVPEDQHCPVRERVVDLVIGIQPDLPLLVTDRPRQPPVRRQDQPDRELGRRRVVYAACVAQRDAFGEPRLDMLEPGRLQLHDLQRGHLADDVEHVAAAHVTRHVELHLVQRRRPLTAGVEIHVVALGNAAEEIARILPRQPSLHVSHVTNLLSRAGAGSSSYS
jgi:hypothetical protein